MARRFWTSRRKWLAAGVAVAVAYVAVLLVWSGGPTGDDHGVPLADTTSGPVLPALTPSPSSSAPKPSASASPGASPSAAAKGFSVPALPQSTSINGAGLPEHAVTMTVTSDASILQLGYRVAYGKSSKRVSYQVESPVRVQAVGRGYGLVAVIAAQASPYATYLTCTVTVDGTVRTHRTVHGGFQVVVCYG